MEIILIFFPLFLLLSQSPAISANIAIKDGNTIVSDDEMFELGFFSPKNTKIRYLGIWYKKISYGTVVWVANRETPITDTSGIFKLGTNGRLMILNGNNTQIWSSNLTVSAVTNLNPVARLLDTGNLVVWDENRTYKNIIWQSFDYPGDTLLPGMKDLVTGIERCLTSWKSDDDPSPGPYVNSIDVNGYPQVFQKQGLVIHFRIGPWNGVRFHGMPMDIPNQLYSTEFIINKKEIYFKYELKSPVAQRVRIRPDGNEMHLKWIDRTQDWIIYANSALDTCGRYGMCGPYGICGINKYPLCRCTEGFVPVFQEQWNAADWSSGCRIKQPLRCGNEDGFRKVSGLKFPDTRNSSYNVSMTLGECEIACKMDCNCTAYANLDIRNGGSGCLMWFGELMDMREYDEDQYIYIKVAASELLGESKASGVLTAVLVLSSAGLFMCVIAYAYRNRKKKRHMKRNRKHTLEKTKMNISVQMDDLDELPCFSLNEIVDATNNFSIDNKIGEGGFGPVYKGMFEDGREVAVKRLSEASQQGLDEFKNEVLLIAKLQHRNLVKLLGYCIHEHEMILIYEYMANNSLDSFIYG